MGEGCIGSGGVYFEGKRCNTLIETDSGLSERIN